MLSMQRYRNDIVPYFHMFACVIKSYKSQFKTATFYSWVWIDRSTVDQMKWDVSLTQMSDTCLMQFCIDHVCLIISFLVTESNKWVVCSGRWQAYLKLETCSLVCFMLRFLVNGNIDFVLNLLLDFYLITTILLDLLWSPAVLLYSPLFF